MRHLRRGAADPALVPNTVCWLTIRILALITSVCGRFIHKGMRDVLSKADYAWHGVVNYKPPQDTAFCGLRQ